MASLLLLGATGVVGRAVLNLALNHPDVQQVTAVTRRPMAAGLLAQHPKLANPVVDMANLPTDASWWRADALICTLGTTIKLAGTPEKFREVDLHLVNNVATLAARHGTHTFVLNSSSMANAKARGLYLRTKGEAEQAVLNAGFQRVVIARPGLLDGNREEFRLGEEIGVKASRLLNPLLPKRLRSVKVERLAAVMLAEALRNGPEITVLESEKFQDG